MTQAKPKQKKADARWALAYVSLWALLSFMLEMPGNWHEFAATLAWLLAMSFTLFNYEKIRDAIPF